MGRVLASLAVGLAAEVGPVLRTRPALVALGLLLALDAGFLLVHAAHLLATHYGVEGSVVSDARFSLEWDGGYAERFEYGKTAACVLALGGCWALTRQPVYAALAAVFGLALADNALELHETWGAALSDLLRGTGAFPRVPNELGELAVFAAEGAAAFALLLLGFRRSAARHRELGLAFVLLLLVLAGFSVGMDLLHAVLRRVVRGLDRILGTVEDGGEFAILSATCALSVALCARLAAERRAVAWPRAATAGAAAVATPAHGLPGGGGRSRALARDAGATGCARRAGRLATDRADFGAGEARGGG